METIHVKTVDPISQELLGAAAARGIDLNWERHEKLQPQDGFQRAGLSCPFGCLEGPCRIDPFGRGPALGSCGLDRDGMVAASLLRLSLAGALEALAGTADGAPDWSGPLGEMAGRAASKLGGGALSANEVFQAAAALSRPGESSAALIGRALRLGLLSLGAANGHGAGGSVKAGYGVLAGGNPVVGLSGAVSADLASGLAAAGGVDVVSLGDWIGGGDGYVPFACTSGEAELALSSGRVALVVAGAGADPAIAALCARLNIPVAAADGSAADIAAAAIKAGNNAEPSAFAPDGAAGEATVVSGDALKAVAGSSGLALVGGADSPFQSLGWIATEVAPALAAKGLSVAAWGDGALWLVKGGREAGIVSGPLAAIEAGLAGSVKGICFTALKDCRDAACALGLAALGLRVCVATPLPVWGSKAVMGELDEALAKAGGSLAHFTQPPGANEVLEWFTGG